VPVAGSSTACSLSFAASVDGGDTASVAGDGSAGTAVSIAASALSSTPTSSSCAETPDASEGPSGASASSCSLIGVVVVAVPAVSPSDAGGAAGPTDSPIVVSAAASQKERPPKGPRFVAVRDEGKVLSSRTDIRMRAEVCGLRLASFWCTDFAWIAHAECVR
jgi:hypothetical protein